VVGTRSPTVYWGARIGGGTYGSTFGDAPWDGQTIARFEQHTQKGASIIAFGLQWYRGGQAQKFEPAPFDAARAHGSIPMVDWNPSDTGANPAYVQPDFQLQDITGGRYDTYIRTWASAAAAWGKPFFLRFCHEMNGTWYPWSELRNGNARGEFVRAWRHVHDIFVQAGARNVTWVWSPNEIAGMNVIPLPSVYPGSAYVDWVGMSGYNWGTFQNSRWTTFAQRLGSTYAALRQLAPDKPMMISEMASSESGGGSKAQWIQDAYGVQLPQNYPAIKAVVWWNRVEGGVDWPIETSASAQAAFAKAIASPYYLSNTFSTLTASPIPAP
jgi:hypothetical protein